MSIVDFKQVEISPAICAYMDAVSAPRSQAQERLLARTRALGGHFEMQIPHQQSILLTMLARSLRAQLIVEVGTFTGYSTIALAEGLSPGGRVVTCDVSEEWSSIAREAFRDAGVADRIDSRLGPAAATLAGLASEPTIDLAFIDADKVSYIHYWELLLPRMRPGGLVIADNALYSGEAAQDGATGNGAAIRAFNAHASRDPRVRCVLLPIADGMLVAQREG